MSTDDGAMGIAQKALNSALNSVKTDKANQNLTPTQKFNARTNIGVPSIDDIVLSPVMDLATAQYDMTVVSGGIASEGVPHGAIDTATGRPYDWALNPCNGNFTGMYGTNPPATWNAATAWLQIYYEDGATWLDTNTRVEVRNIQLWVKLVSNGEWLCLSLEEAPLGAAYPENFTVNAAGAIDQRLEPSRGTSVKMVLGNTYHAYARSRVVIPLNDIAAVYSSFETRLVLHDKTQPDDRASAHYVASGGADYWRSLTAANLAGLANNGPVMMGRFKRITNDWKVISSCTYSPAQMTNLDVLPPLTPNRSYLNYSLQHRQLSLGNVYNALDYTTAGAVLDARQGKSLNDKITTLSGQVVGISAALGSGVITVFDGIPPITAALNGQTLLVDASSTLTLPLPANLSGPLTFRVVQAGSQPIVFASSTGATIYSVGNALQTNGQWKEYVVRLLRNTTGTAAEWTVSGDLVTAASTPSTLWTPYQHGLTAQDVWFDALSTGSIKTVGSKVSQITDKSQNARSVIQATDSLRPTLGTLNGKPAFQASVASPAQMLWNGTALTNVLDLFYNGGAFLSANLGTSFTYANEPFAEKIILFIWNTTNAYVHINGATSPANGATGAFNGSGYILLVHAPTSAGQSNLGRIFQGNNKALFNSSGGSRGYDGSLRELLVSNVDISSGTTARNLINGYAAARWNLQSLLPSDHPYKSVAPTF